jgi:hypothetical protein
MTEGPVMVAELSKESAMNNRTRQGNTQSAPAPAPAPAARRETVRFNIQSGTKFNDAQGNERTVWSTLGTAFENRSEKGRTIKLIFDRGMPHPDAELVLFEATSDASD